MSTAATQRDPCVQIQVDLSAMLDGELDDGSVRRVMVHAAACPYCGPFLQGIQRQVRAHRDLHEVLDVNAGGHPGRPERLAVAQLRQQLTANRSRLARIFYELGRGFVLMGTSPRFSRTVQREPVPIPDMLRRGELLLDEVGSLEAPAEPASEERPWVRAKSLLAKGRMCSQSEYLDRGKSLLRESLALDPDAYEPRIYLGHALHVEGHLDPARAEFRAAIESGDCMGRVFGLMHLGNLQIDERDWAGAVESFEGIVQSGVIADQVQFGLVYFNLALCCGHLLRFEACEVWLQRLHSELPHKRRIIGREIVSQSEFLGLLREHPPVLDRLIDQFPIWFRTTQTA